MRAIITGAASGIGLATARRLQTDSQEKRGCPAQLVLADRDAEYLEQAAVELSGLGATVKTCVADLIEPSGCSDVVAVAADAFDGLDGLVSNAGIVQQSSLLDLSVDNWDRTFAVNTRATWLLAKEAYPLLKSAKGAIVATASIAAYEPYAELGAYSASKAALVMLIRQLACAWGPEGIRANTVSPGGTRTNIGGRELTARLPAELPSNNPLGFVAQPYDQAAAIAFLLSTDARFITGADIVVDGGSRTQLPQMTGWHLAEKFKLTS